ncbi:MAG: photosystem I reaction center subunit VIII [Cyanothece sp. SIO1E1]|nr:photosystem I reaction center subunit VIII [Cyanothece sp. SIO1E1]
MISSYFPVLFVPLFGIVLPAVGMALFFKYIETEAS